MRNATLVTFVFAICTTALLGFLPLWLDEILQLIETRDTSTAEMIAQVPRNSGAVPLGYLVQHAALRVTGYSVRRARLPAALFGIFCVFAVALLAREMGMRCIWLPAMLFASFPEILRYATEARIYSQALFFSLIATILYLRLAKQAKWTTTFVLGLVFCAAVYTQPFTLFIGLALVIWSVILGEFKTALRGSAALAVACVAFLPWYIWAKTDWISSVSQRGWHFFASARTPLMIFREATGGGYWGSGLLLILCIFAIVEQGDRKRWNILLALLMAVPLVGALAADAAMDYFIAARQFIWILPAAAIMAATSIESASFRNRSCLIVVAVAMIGVGVRQSVTYFRAPHENWQVAADAIVLRAQGGCVESPGDAVRVYRFFRPEISQEKCDPSRLVLAITPETTPDERTGAERKIALAGYAFKEEVSAGGSTILLFQRSLSR